MTNQITLSRGIITKIFFLVLCQIGNSLAARIDEFNRMDKNERQSLEQDHMEGVEEHEWED